MMIKTDNLNELRQNLIDAIEQFKLYKKNLKANKEIKMYLLENHQILEGEIQKWFDDPNNFIPFLDIRLLCLLAEQVYLKTGQQMLNPTNYFTDNEIKEAKQYSDLVRINENKIDFPITFNNAVVLGNSAYLITLNIHTIKELLDNQLLYYNFDLQREAKFIKRKDKIIMEPYTNKKNIEEITQHLLEGTLVPTTMVFNAAVRTSDSGTEIHYDPRKLELTITKGTRLDIVDGYHRCKAIQKALLINPDIEFNFAIIITNYTTKRAMQYQAQLAKATPISKVRVQALEANRLSDTVVQQLRDESDLKGKISQDFTVKKSVNQLVSYNVLADTIDEEFNLQTRADAADVGDYLVEFFNYLIDGYKEDFLNPLESRKKSLIADNNMFVGYIVLARKMYEKGVKARRVLKYIENIDFSKENPLWKEIGVLDEKLNINFKKARSAIRKYFSKIEVGE